MRQLVREIEFKMKTNGFAENLHYIVYTIQWKANFTEQIR